MLSLCLNHIPTLTSLWYLLAYIITILFRDCFGYSEFKLAHIPFSFPIHGLHAVPLFVKPRLCVQMNRLNGTSGPFLHLCVPQANPETAQNRLESLRVLYSS